jgi:putative membrane protein
MKQIYTIFSNDIKNITKNWAALVIIAGLVFLPSLYAWFNIMASWDPYGQTRELAIAVANNDQGASLRGKQIQLGQEIIEALRENRSIKWIFTDEAEAIRGVNHGDYYASITIPTDFSAKIATVITPNPQKAEIVYHVNEKINAISPKVTATGASSVIEQVNQNFVQTASAAIFQIMNELGVELESGLPTIEQLRQLIFKLETMFPDIKQSIATATVDIERLGQILDQVQKQLPTFLQLAQDGKDLTSKLSQFLSQGAETINAIGPDIKSNLLLIQQAAIATEQITGMLQDANINVDSLKDSLDRASQRLTTSIDVIDKMIGVFQNLNQMIGGDKLSSVIQKLQQVKTKFQQQITVMGSIKDALNKGEKPAQNLIDNLNQLSKDASNLLEDILSRFDSDIMPHIVNGLNKASQTAQNANKILTEASESFPDIEKILNDAAAGSALGKEVIKDIQQRLPSLENTIKHLADQIRALERETDLKEIIDLLKLNAQKESEFWANPVLLKEIKLFPIPNYGSAMSPFFTTLSLWVGALLLVSLLTVDVHHPIDGKAAPYRSHEVYFGRYLTFMTLAVLQSIFVTLGDIYLLNCYVYDKLWFILFGMLLSAVFMFIVYTLVSVFGNVGKAMAIVLLVLQLAGSGGTFPIQMTPPFFQAIHPYLPFTYGISMMREAVGGILWDIVLNDLIMMSSYVIIMLLIGLALKKWINRVSSRFVKKARDSKLIH